MFYVYVLKSNKDNGLYLGYTNNLKRIIDEHNNGLSCLTKLRKPFELINFEGYKSEKDARERENNLKLRSRAFVQLNERIATSLS